MGQFLTQDFVGVACCKFEGDRKTCNKLPDAFKIAPRVVLHGAIFNVTMMRK